MVLVAPVAAALVGVTAELFPPLTGSGSIRTSHSTPGAPTTLVRMVNFSLLY